MFIKPSGRVCVADWVVCKVLFMSSPTRDRALRILPTEDLPNSDLPTPFCVIKIIMALTPPYPLPPP